MFAKTLGQISCKCPNGRFQGSEFMFHVLVIRVICVIGGGLQKFGSTFIDLVLAVCTVRHLGAVAQDGVFGVTTERLATGIEDTGLQFTTEAAGWGKLQFLLGWKGAQLVGSLVGVEVLTLGNVDEGKGAEAVDGYTELAFGELEAYLVDEGRQHLLYGGLTDAGTLGYSRSYFLEILLWKHILKSLT